MTQRAPLVHVVVLNYNDSRWLEPCLRSLIGTDYENLQVILVDNGSTDGSVERAIELFPTLKVLRNHINVGFSEGNNAGIRHALAQGADYIVLVNPDTRVESEWLREIVRVGESEPTAGIFGAVQLRYDDDEFNDWTTTALRDHLDELRSAGARDWIEVQWVEGSCFAIKRQTVENVGLLDPIYRAFYEEIDYCRRAACRGWRTLLVTRSRIHHQRGGHWKASPAIERRRNFLADLSQFIYAATDPRQGLTANLTGYVTTLGTKLKDAVASRDAKRVLDVARLQAALLVRSASIARKWRRDRQRLRTTQAAAGGARSVTGCCGTVRRRVPRLDRR